MTNLMFRAAYFLEDCTVELDDARTHPTRNDDLEFFKEVLLLTLVDGGTDSLHNGKIRTVLRDHAHLNHGRLD